MLLKKNRIIKDIIRVIMSFIIVSYSGGIIIAIKAMLVIAYDFIP